MVTPLLIVTGPITLPFSPEAIVWLVASVLVFILIGVAPLANCELNLAAVTVPSAGVVKDPVSPSIII